MSDITIDAALVQAHVTDFSGDARDVTELRLLIELSAVRELADRGLSDPELAVAGRLADATMQAARSGDIEGYERADADFHLCLLELTGDPAVALIGRHLLAARPAPGAQERGRPMTVGADENRKLVTMLAGGMVTAADNLLRNHLARPSVGPNALVPSLTGPTARRPWHLTRSVR
jgi:DNA-binding GntR family transcriptional regulator